MDRDMRGTDSRGHHDLIHSQMQPFSKPIEKVTREETKRIQSPDGKNNAGDVAGKGALWAGQQAQQAQPNATAPTAPTAPSLNFDCVSQTS